jgi:hypothetical protein
LWVDHSSVYTIPAKFYECFVIRGFDKIVPGSEAAAALRDFIESQPSIETNAYSTLVSFAVSALGFTHMHGKAGTPGKGTLTVFTTMH